MTNLILPMEEMPKVISDSIRDALRARGLTLSEDVVLELGKNASHCLTALDETPDDAAPQPLTSDLFAVGHTLRMLARTAPGPGTSASMNRVGDWLVEKAAEAMKREAA